MPQHRPTRLGSFEILARIAKGGMAEIYLARQTVGGGASRLVVVKRILPHLAEERDFVEMFTQEALLAWRINHPNVVQIIDVQQSGGDPFIAMEYIDGPSLSAVMRRAADQGTPMPHAVAAEIVAQACDGLNAAHELCDDTGEPLGLVHRDVSPQNLMLSELGVVKLVDFGIAKAQGSTINTSTGNIKGKYPYMSPEQCTGQPLDRRTDIFSLGIVFFELLSAKRLFKRETDLMTLKAITEDALPGPREFGTDVPDALARVVLRALSREREARFPTAEAMAEAVRDALAQLGIGASPRAVQGYLREACGDLLAARRAAVDRLVDLPGRYPSVLSLDDPDTHAALDEAETRALRKEAGPRRTPAEGIGDEHEDEHEDEDEPATRPLGVPLSDTPPPLPPRIPGITDTATLPGGPLPHRRSPLPDPRGGAHLPRALLLVGGVVVVLAAAAGLVYRSMAPRPPRTTTASSAPPEAGAPARPDTRVRPGGPAVRFGFPNSYAESVWRAEVRPLLDYLEDRVGRRFELVVPPSYVELRRAFLAGAVAVAYLPPVQYVLARHDHPGITPLATPLYQGASTYQAFFIVGPTAREAEDLKDLKGKRFCYADRGSASGYLYPRRHLRKRGFDPDAFFSEVHFSGDHFQVAADVLAGKCDAGAVYSSAYHSANAHGVAIDRLPILITLRNIPYDAVCAAPGLDAALAEKIRRALLAFRADAVLGRKVLGDTVRINRFVPVAQGQYDGVEEAVRAEGLLR